MIYYKRYTRKLLPQELHQVHRGGKPFLLLGKMDVGHDCLPPEKEKPWAYCPRASGKLKVDTHKAGECLLFSYLLK